MLEFRVLHYTYYLPLVKLKLISYQTSNYVSKLRYERKFLRKKLFQL